jgi:diketogulonate reductase-like aldo/keto reductase
MYGNGRAEEIVGKAIAGRRGEVFLVSKVLPSNASYEGTLRACERSLQRLGADRLDLYLLHWPSEHPIEATMRAFEELVKRRMTRYIGVSNFDVPALQGAEAALRHERLACNQVLYHLKARGIERKLLPYCREKGIALMGYSPFGHGDLPEPRSQGGAVLNRIASEEDCTVRQVILNFLIRDGVFVIPKAGRSEHVRENSEAQDWMLSKSQCEEINCAFPAPKHDVPLETI